MNAVIANAEAAATVKSPLITTAAEWIDAAKEAGLEIGLSYDIETGAPNFYVGVGKCGFGTVVWPLLNAMLPDIGIDAVTRECVRREAAARAIRNGRAA